MNNFLYLAQQQFGQPFPEEPNFFIVFLVSWGPLFFVAFILFAFLRGMIKKTNAIHVHSQAHMESMQAKTDEMIQLLKEIRDKQ